jgi:polyhydroxybutyrate depolymerase
MGVRAAATGLLCLLAAFAQAGTREIRVATPDGERPALVVEVDSPGRAPRPLVLLLHGHMGSAAQALGMKRFSPSPLSAWVDIARRDNIVVAALDGNRGSDGEQGWNDCRGDAGNNPHSDDVAYARAVVKQLVAEGRADPARVYAMGMSNGGMMAFRLGLEMPELAAFAAVSASMAADSRCPELPSAQTAALIISGDADPLVPYQGGQVHFGRGAPRGGVIPVPAAFAAWAQAHHHEVAAARRLLLPAQLQGDATAAEAGFFGSTPARSDVVLVRVEGGGHVEPSLAHRYRPFYLHIVGPQSSAFESAQFAWDFFRNKSRPPAQDMTTH